MEVGEKKIFCCESHHRLQIGCPRSDLIPFFDEWKYVVDNANK
jgi:hypothetical protein